MRIAILFADSHPTEMPASHSEDDAKYRTLSQPLRPDRQFTTVPVHNDVFPAEDSAFDSHIYTSTQHRFPDRRAIATLEPLSPVPRLTVGGFTKMPPTAPR